MHLVALFQCHATEKVFETCRVQLFRINTGLLRIIRYPKPSDFESTTDWLSFISLSVCLKESFISNMCLPQIIIINNKSIFY